VYFPEHVEHFVEVYVASSHPDFFRLCKKLYEMEQEMHNDGRLPPNVTCSPWTRTLLEIFPNDDDMANWKPGDVTELIEPLVAAVSCDTVVHNSAVKLAKTLATVLGRVHTLEHQLRMAEAEGALQQQSSSQGASPATHSVRGKRQREQVPACNRCGPAASGCA
jgi:hypothetical protein